MPDAEALTMDAPVRPGPPLSATSDAASPNATPDNAPALSDEVVGGARTRDAQGRFAKADTPVDSQSAPFQPETEPTVGEQETVEATGADQETRKPEVDPAAAAGFARRDARIAALEAKVAELSAPKPPEPKPRPRYEEFSDPNAYEDAVVQWAKDEGAREAEVRAAKDRQEAAQRARADAIVTTWNDRVKAFEADHPDFRAVTGADDLSISQAMTAAIAQVENGPAVAYHLGQDKAEAARISLLEPFRAAVEIGRLSQELMKPAAPPARRLPNPPPDRGSRAAPPVKDRDAMSTDEYAELPDVKERLAWNARR